LYRRKDFECQPAEPERTKVIELVWQNELAGKFFHESVGFQKLKQPRTWESEGMMEGDSFELPKDNILARKPDSFYRNERGSAT
jgi:hypothetical protein